MIHKLKVAWFWVKMHSVAVMGGVITILLGIITLGAYNRKIGSLKDAVKVEQAMKDVAALEAKRDAAVAAEGNLAAQDAQLAAKDDSLETKITEAKKQAVAAREVVEGKTDEEIAARFNQLYRN